MAPARLAADKKGARRTGRTIAFLDETGHTFRARVGTTWAPVGCAPVLRRISTRRAVSSLVAVTAPLAPSERAHLYARHFGESIRTAHVLMMLRYLRARVGRPLVIVWDHLSAHRSKVVRAFLGKHRADFQVEWLPGYAPELNPEEQCNNCVKLAMLNAVPRSVDELHRLVRLHFQRLGRKPHLLHHFFDHAGLSVT